jgi:hypothetical protein
MVDTPLAATAPLNTDASLFTPVPTINYRKQKGNLFDVGADVNINPANNQASLPGTTAVAATTGPGTLSTDFANGSVVDGVTLSTSDVILIKDQADPSKNGVYTVAVSGAPARTTGWTNGVGLQAFQKTVEILGGTVNSGKFFVQTNNVLSPFIVVDTTPLNFAEDSNQLVNQRNILAATAPALTRQNARPLTSSPFLREFGGVITFDNNTLEQFYPKQPVKAATTTTLAANTYSGGVLTASGDGAIGAIDGVTLAVGDRLLVMHEASALKNGIYVVTALGDGSNPYVLTRPSDASEGSAGADAGFTVAFGMCVFVSSGTVNGKNTFFQSTANPITMGTTAQVFLNLNTVMTVNLTNQPQDGNQNVDSQSYTQA